MKSSSSLTEGHFFKGIVLKRCVRYLKITNNSSNLQTIIHFNNMCDYFHLFTKQPEKNNYVNNCYGYHKNITVVITRFSTCNIMHPKFFFSNHNFLGHNPLFLGPVEKFEDLSIDSMFGTPV